MLQTQFISVISGTVLYPHLYEDGIVNRVVALTKVISWCSLYYVFIATLSHFAVLQKL